MQKECGACHEWKELSHFGKDRRGKHGVLWICKPCLKIRMATKIASHPIDVSNITRKCTACKKVKELSTFCKHRLGTYGYRAICKSCELQQRLNDFPGQIVQGARLSDRTHKRVAEANQKYITRDWVINQVKKQGNKCIYCTIPMIIGQKRRGVGDALTVERMDNTLPHYQSNCVLSCWECNARRQNLSSFQHMCRWGMKMKVGIVKHCPGPLHDGLEQRMLPATEFLARDYCRACEPLRQKKGTKKLAMVSSSDKIV